MGSMAIDACVNQYASVCWRGESFLKLSPSSWIKPVAPDAVHQGPASGEFAEAGERQEENQRSPHTIRHPFNVTRTSSALLAFRHDRNQKSSERISFGDLRTVCRLHSGLCCSPLQ